MNRAYAAGIIDGEGHIGFSKTRSVYYPRALIVNTNRDLLEDFKYSYGGSIHELTRAKDNWKIAYQWQIGNRACVNFLELICDYLQLKYNQAFLVFAWDEIRPGKGGYWSEESLEAMHMILDQIKWLNARGIQGQTTTSPIDQVLYDMSGWK